MGESPVLLQKFTGEMADERQVRRTRQVEEWRRRRGWSRKSVRAFVWMTTPSPAPADSNCGTAAQVPSPGGLSQPLTANQRPCIR